MPKIVPFGNRILVRRRKVGEKAGSLYLPDSVKDRNTDIADVIEVPELTFSDKYILDNAEKVIGVMTEKVKQGDSHALTALLEINHFVKIKSIKPGDVVFMSKYVGTTFHETGKNEELTLVSGDDIIGYVVGDKNGKQ